MLNKEELYAISGGASWLTIGGIVGGVIAFVSGFIEGLLRPSRCN